MHIIPSLGVLHVYLALGANHAGSWHISFAVEDWILLASVINWSVTYDMSQPVLLVMHAGFLYL